MIPSVRTISELTKKSLYGLALDDLDKTLEKALSHHLYSDTEGFTLTLYFGKTHIEPLQDLARQLFEVFPCPILLVEFRRTNGWHIEGIKSGTLHKLRDDQEDQFANALDGFSRKVWRVPRSKQVARYDLAILHDTASILRCTTRSTSPTCSTAINWACPRRRFCTRSDPKISSG